MGKTLTIEQALAATETELSKITSASLSPAAKKSVQTALGLIRGTRTAYAARTERQVKQAGAGTTKIKEVPKSSVASPKESAEARRRRLLNSTATGAQVVRSADQKGKN